MHWATDCKTFVWNYIKAPHETCALSINWQDWSCPAETAITDSFKARPAQGRWTDAKQTCAVCKHGLASKHWATNRTKQYFGMTLNKGPRLPRVYECKEAQAASDFTFQNGVLQNETTSMPIMRIKTATLSTESTPAVTSTTTMTMKTPMLTTASKPNNVKYDYKSFNNAGKDHHGNWIVNDPKMEQEWQ